MHSNVLYTLGLQMRPRSGTAFTGILAGPGIHPIQKSGLVRDAATGPLA